VSGLYWFRDNGSAPSTLAPGFSAPVPTFETNAVENKSQAAFLHGEYHLTSRWSVAAGARRTEDRRVLDDNDFQDQSSLGGPTQFCTIVDATTQLPLGFPPGGPCPSVHKEVAFGYWSGELSSRYRFSDGLTGYVRAGRAQRSGGWNAPVNFLQDAPFRPEQLTDFEIGLKSNFLDGRGMLSTAVFTGNYNDMQRLLARFVGGTPTSIVINAGKARVSGVEVESSLRVTADFELQASFGRTDARYLQFTDTFGNDASGNQFYMTPKYTWSLAGAYDIPVAFGSFHLRADYSWRDSVEFNVLNDFNRQPSVGLLSARLAYASRDRSFEVALFGTNLTDKQYAYNGGTIVNPGGPPIASWQAAADRRLYGVEMTYQLRSAR
jgi:iron complex outermembrane recepter protein